MVNTRKPPSVVSAPTSPAPVLIGSEQDAAEAFGEYHGLGDFLRRPPRSPVVICELPGGGVALPQGSTLRVQWPGRPGQWALLQLWSDPTRSPPLRCEIDGEAIQLEQHEGVWRPVRTEGDG